MRAQRIYIERILAVLIDLFGREAVAETLEAFGASEHGKTPLWHNHKKAEHGKTPFHSTHEQFAEMRIFLDGLRSGELLPEAEDVRQFANIAGIKRLQGKSRRDLLKNLLRAMDKIASEQIIGLLREAPYIKAAVRRDGFAVLTDKLLEDIGQNGHADFPPKGERRR